MFIEHALMTADVAIAFVAEARKHPGHQMSEWEPDWQAAERLRSRTVIPDGHFVYATPEWEVHAFVEVDLGTERPIRFAQKITAYLAAYRSSSWRAQLPTWPLVQWFDEVRIGHKAESIEFVPTARTRELVYVSTSPSTSVELRFINRAARMRRG